MIPHNGPGAMRGRGHRQTRRTAVRSEEQIHPLGQQELRIVEGALCRRAVVEEAKFERTALPFNDNPASGVNVPQPEVQAPPRLPALNRMGGR